MKPQMRRSAHAAPDPHTSLPTEHHGGFHDHLLQTPTGPPDADAPQDNMTTQHKTTPSLKTRHALKLAAALVVSALTPAWAGAGSSASSDKQPAPTTPVAEASAFDQIWNLAKLYSNKENPYIQEFSIFGRFHENWASEQLNVGNWSDWEARRVRAGAQLKFLEQFTLKAEVRFQPLNSPIYDGLTETTISWSPDPAFVLTVGKQLPRFTAEGSISSNDLLTVERSLLANTFWIGEDNFSTGVSISGKAGNWQYFASILSGESNKNFGELNAGYYAVASIGYDFAKSLNVDRALLRADYVYNNGDKGNTVTKPFENTAVLGFEFKDKAFGLFADIARGSGLGTQPDVWGFVITPTYAITKQLELVTRYTFLDSGSANGIKPERRYENNVAAVTGTKGNRYQAAYAGLNYYIYGNKLKFQTGVEYSDMKSVGAKGAFSGWSYLSGFRFSF